MNLRDLTYFVKLAELGHFGRASEACNVSQPTLSMQLKKLEQTLGVALFERTRHKVLPTEAGLRLLVKARAILQLAEEMTAISKANADPLAGEMTLGVFPTLAPYLLPLAMPAIKKRLPGLSVRLLEEKTADLLEKLEAGKLDCALLALPVTHPGIEAQPIFSEPFLFACPPSHPLAQKKRLNLSDLDGHNLLLLDEGHCLREQALAVCRRIGAKESDNFRATSLETLRQMVAAGTAATLIPRLAVRKDAAIRYIPFEDPQPERSIALCFRKMTSRAVLMEKLAQVISHGAAQAGKHIG